MANMALPPCRPMRPNADSQTVNDLGEPDAGNPPVRFDEGRGVVHSPRALNDSPPTLPGDCSDPAQGSS